MSYRIKKEQVNKFKNVKIRDYIIQDIIGQGAFGRVFKVQNSVTNCVKALKHIQLSDLEFDQAISQISEAIIPPLLHCPHVVTVEEYFVEQQDAALGQTVTNLYIIMELADFNAEVLINQWKINNGNTRDVILDIFLQILIGVSTMHKNKIIHQDIKPQNILIVKINQQNVAKVCDFGCAKLQTKESIRIVGTSNYISPEIVNNLPHGLATDVWSLGCILYEFSLLSKAFQGQTELEVLNSVKQYKNQLNVLNKQTILNRYGNDILDLILRMLKSNPSDRVTCDQLLMCSIFQSNFLKYNAKLLQEFSNSISIDAKNQQKIDALMITNNDLQQQISKSQSECQLLKATNQKLQFQNEQLKKQICKVQQVSNLEWPIHFVFCIDKSNSMQQSVDFYEGINKECHKIVIEKIPHLQAIFYEGSKCHGEIINQDFTLKTDRGLQSIGVVYTAVCNFINARLNQKIYSDLYSIIPFDGVVNQCDIRTTMHFNRGEDIFNLLPEEMHPLTCFAPPLHEAQKIAQQTKQYNSVMIFCTDGQNEDDRDLTNDLILQVKNSFKNRIEVLAITNSTCQRINDSNFQKINCFANKFGKECIKINDLMQISTVINNWQLRNSNMETKSE